MARQTARLKGITAYLTPEEYEAVTASAKRAKLSRSKFLKLVSTGQPVKSLEHVEERLELRKLKGALGSLGGLLKQAIAAEAADRAEVSRLLRQLDDRQRSIQALIDRMK